MNNIQQKILKKLKIELADKFDKNFSQGGFFGNRWKPKKDGSASHLIGKGSGVLRRSIKSYIEGDSIVFTSSTPYAAAHNEGVNKRVSVRSKKGKTFTRKMNLPQRQFIGEYDGMVKTVERIATQVLDNEMKKIVAKHNQ